jgi:hypothetical protein
VKAQRSRTVTLRRGARWLTLAGLTVLLAGLAWDLGLHLVDPEVATDVGVALWSVPAHQVTAGGAILTAIGMALTHAQCRTTRRTHGSGIALRLAQTLGILGLAGAGLTLVASGDTGRSALHGWFLGVTHPAEEPAIRLQYQLLADPIDLRALPTELLLEDLRPHPLSGRLRAYQAVGGVNVFLQGPGLSNRIGYRIFPSAADAAGYFEPADLGLTFTLLSRSVGASREHPARCETYRYVAQATHVTATDCLELVGNVVAVGTAAQEGDGGPDQAERAEALVRLGAEHVSRVTAQDR